ncbi:hypothetical protein H2200_009654 [Cladophialophora chaetospira]|uniref:Altered inheritance of mitochondria protein 6 n=1 Tax=Cladophialophora chaetospira TaxID=386627 RepID=A0AA38X2X7_9EURO|nr:hypothetical protein H2200_009654 [Cladophialophora chaetospira]
MNRYFNSPNWSKAWYIPPHWLASADVKPVTIVDAALIASQAATANHHRLISHSSIPLILHQTWKSRRIETWSELLRNSVEKWLEYVVSDDMAYFFWDDEGVTRLLDHFEPDFVDHFHSLPTNVERSDVFRVLVLKWFGGIYADVDTQALRKPAGWVSTSDLAPWTDPVSEIRYTSNSSINLILGIEADCPPDGNEYWRMGYTYPVQLTQWALASSSSHPVLLRFMETLTYYLQAIADRNGGDLKSPDALRELRRIGPLSLTGPVAITGATQSWLKTKTGLRWNALTGLHDGGRSKAVGDVLVLPITGFSVLNDARNLLAGKQLSLATGCGTKYNYIDSQKLSLAATINSLPDYFCLDGSQPVIAESSNNQHGQCRATKPSVDRGSLHSGLRGANIRLCLARMPPTRYNRFKRKPGRVRFAVNEGEASTGKDVELGHYVQTRDSSGGIPDIAKGPGQSGAQPFSLFSKVPESSSSGPSRARYASWKPWSASRKRQRPASRSLIKALSLLKLSLMLLGVLQCFNYVCSILSAFFPDELDLVSGPFRDSIVTLESGTSEAWRDDLTADVQPLMCHSHNDYWRREPLYRAIQVGCTGVESDIWHFDDELYVAHTISGIRQNRTLKSLYLDPLKDILNRQNQFPDFLGPLDRPLNGVFATHPKQSLVLLIDFKNDPEPTWSRLESHLTYFRDKKYLTYFNGTSVVRGPLTIVVSGKAPFSRIVQSSTYRDVFYDAPLDVMASLPTNGEPSTTSLDSLTHANDSSLVDTPQYLQNAGTYSPANSYYASVSFIRSIGYPWHSSLSQAQLDLLRRQIRDAHARGLKARYWGIPAWPVGVRNYVWRVLVREGVDYLSVDDVDAVTRDDWGPRKGGWGKKWWR